MTCLVSLARWWREASFPLEAEARWSIWAKVDIQGPLGQQPKNRRSLHMCPMAKGCLCQTPRNWSCCVQP